MSDFSKLQEKYNNWRTSIESDSLSLFIKTWFAYLATLHDLHKDVHSKTGDKAIINKYAVDSLKKISPTEEIKEEIKKVFEISKVLIRSEFLEYYFATFYKINFKYKFKEVNVNKTIDFTIKIKGVKKDRRLVILVRQKTTKFRDTFGYFIEANINLSKIIKDGEFEKEIKQFIK